MNISRDKKVDTYNVRPRGRSPGTAYFHAPNTGLQARCGDFQDMDGAGKMPSPSTSILIPDLGHKNTLLVMRGMICWFATNNTKNYYSRLRFRLDQIPFLLSCRDFSFEYLYSADQRVPLVHLIAPSSYVRSVCLGLLQVRASFWKFSTPMGHMTHSSVAICLQCFLQCMNPFETILLSKVESRNILLLHIYMTQTEQIFFFLPRKICT